MGCSNMHLVRCNGDGVFSKTACALRSVNVHMVYSVSSFVDCKNLSLLKEIYIVNRSCQ